LFALFGKKEKALPLCIDVKTQNAPKGAKLYQFFPKIKPPYYIQGHSKFSKKAKKKIKNGRGALAPLRSARFLVHFSKIPVCSVRRNGKILRYCLEFPGEAGRGAAWKRLCKKQEAGPGAVRRRGLRF
jgi:hypothetical protein